MSLPAAVSAWAAAVCGRQSGGNSWLRTGPRSPPNRAVSAASRSVSALVSAGLRALDYGGWHVGGVLQRVQDGLGRWQASCGRVDNPVAFSSRDGIGGQYSVGRLCKRSDHVREALIIEGADGRSSYAVDLFVGDASGGVRFPSGPLLLIRLRRDPSAAPQHLPSRFRRDSHSQVGRRIQRLGEARLMSWVGGLRMARFVSRSLRVGARACAAECLGNVASALQPNRGETYMSCYLNHSP